jgi:hypothetical protein
MVNYQYFTCITWKPVRRGEVKIRVRDDEVFLGRTIQCLRVPTSAAEEKVCDLCKMKNSNLLKVRMSNATKTLAHIYDAPDMYLSSTTGQNFGGL